MLIKALKEFDRTGLLPSYAQNQPLSPDVSVNARILREIFYNCSDVVFRPIQVHGQTKMLLIYVDGLSDTKLLDEVVLRPTLFEGLPRGFDNFSTFGEVIEQQLVAIAQIRKVSITQDVVDGVLKANTAILVDGEGEALLADLKGFEKRGVEEPAAEVAIRAPRDGFTETLRINTSLVRRRIASPQLKMEPLIIGQVSKTDVVIMYMEGIAPNTVLEEVRNRLRRIQIDSVLGSGYLEEFIEDVPWSPFPQIQNTERPDVVCGSLLEGKVAIMVDHTPFVLIVPMTFWTGLQAVEDYYERFIYTSSVRLLRLLLVSVSLFLPALFVAITTYHPQLLPTNLLISILAARERIPFPAVMETLLMDVMFEGLREAGLRLPKPAGAAVSIVGALVIGEAAVQADIVSASVVIVVATTGIASFAIPRYNFGIAFRLLRFPMLMLGATLGLYGVLLGTIALTIHLVGLRSFGIPYLSPVAPQIPGNLKDVFLRAPRWSMNSRPVFISGVNKKRIPEGQRPSPKQGKRGK